jgi:hypothetical protein
MVTKGLAKIPFSAGSAFAPTEKAISTELTMIDSITDILGSQAIRIRRWLVVSLKPLHPQK